MPLRRYTNTFTQAALVRHLNRSKTVLKMQDDHRRILLLRCWEQAGQRGLPVCRNETRNGKSDKVSAAGKAFWSIFEQITVYVTPKSELHSPQRERSCSVTCAFRPLQHGRVQSLSSSKRTDSKDWLHQSKFVLRMLESSGGRIRSSEPGFGLSPARNDITRGMLDRPVKSRPDQKEEEGVVETLLVKSQWAR